MPQKLTPLNKLDFTALIPAQVKMSQIFEIGAGRLQEIFKPGGNFSCICECICNCICDCICDCICELDWRLNVRSRLPVRAIYEVEYELKDETSLEYGDQNFKQTRMLLEMDPKIVDKLREKTNLKEVETLKTGAKRYLLKNAINRRGE